MRSPLLALLCVGCATVPIQVSSNRLHRAVVRLQESPSVEVLGVELDRDSWVRTPTGARVRIVDLAAGCSVNPSVLVSGCGLQESTWFEIGRERARRRQRSERTRRIGGTLVEAGAAIGAAAAASAAGGEYVEAEDEISLDNP
ncbi:MAG: hypothetical protein AAF938_04265 [Myxococcota bacterium]